MRQRQNDGVSIFIKIMMRRGRCECSDWLKCVPKAARPVLRCQIDVVASSLNRPLDGVKHDALVLEHMY